MKVMDEGRVRWCGVVVCVCVCVLYVHAYVRVYVPALNVHKNMCKNKSHPEHFCPGSCFQLLLFCVVDAIDL